MSAKTLKIRRVFAWSIFNNLKNIPPKDYPTTGEIKSTISEVLPALKAHVEVYMDIVKRAVELQEKAATKTLSTEEINAEVEKVNKELGTYNKEHGSEVVDVALDGEGFTTLKAQFDREGWGKKWMANIEEFGELVEAFAEAGK